MVYPYIVSVKDPLSGYLFNFAGLAYIEPNEDPVETLEPNEGMRPGSCAQIDFSQYTGQTMNCDCINEGDCQDVTVRVEGYDVDNAVVSYGSCSFTEQGNGDYVTEVPYDVTATLRIFKNESYETLVMQNVNSNELSGTYRLRRKPDIRVHYHDVIVESAGFPGINPVYTSCYVRRAAPNSIISTSLEGEESWSFVPNFNEDAPSMEQCKIDEDDVKEKTDSCTDCSGWEAFWGGLFGGDCGPEEQEECVLYVIDSELTSVGECITRLDPPLINDEIDIGYVPGGYTYTFDVDSINVHGFWSQGRMSYDYELSELDHDLYVYIPGRNKPGFEQRYEFSNSEMNNLMNFVQNSCGIELISETQQAIGRITP